MSYCTFNSLGVFLSAVLGLASLTEISAADKKDQKAAKAENLHQEVDLPMHGMVRLFPTKDSSAHGMLWLTQTKDGLSIQGKVEGLTPGLHGFHVHEYGDLSDPEGKSAGGHFNPDNAEHGSPKEEHHHAGDLGNIEANDEGVAEVDMKAPWLKLHFVVGRSFVVHAGEDDLKSQPSGDAGGRAAVGVIGIAQTKNTSDQ